MHIITPEDRQAMRDSFARVLQAHGAEAQVRRTMDSASGIDPALWRQLAELGIIGVLVAQALADGAPDADVLMNLAAFACADTFSQVAAASIQMHSGIGFTWEHPAHLYRRRARTDAQLFGTSAFCRDRYLSALEATA